MESTMKQDAFAKRIIRVLGALLLVAGSIAVAGCYYMPAVGGSGVARATIGVTKSPVNVVSAALVVGGPGMDTITNTYAAGITTATLTIPSGAERTFTLLVNSPSATLIGTSTVDLAPGETRTIALSPTIAGTQIVIPDYLNHRIVQISDMTGTGWVEKKTGDFVGTGAQFSPYAIDFDNQGRIYIANYTISTPGAIGAVVRIDDINHTGAPGTSGVVNIDATSMNVTSLAVDRANGYVYYVNLNSLLRKRIDDDYTVSPTTSALSSESLIHANPSAIAVDDQGFLYMTIPAQTFAGSVVKYNPTLAVGSRVVRSSTYNFPYPGFTSPFGVMVKGAYVYVSDSGGGKIVRFDKDLNFVDSYTPPSARPETFLATLNRKITLIDEGSNGTTDRIDSLDDMTGAGLETFGSNGSGTNQFSFYSIC
jgi:hypothetical protein